MRAKHLSETPKEAESIASDKENNKSIAIPIPSLPKNITMTQLMVAALVVAAFLLGMLTTKVQYLEKNGSSTQTTTAAAQTAPAAAAPQAQPTLGKQNVSIGHLPPKGDPNAKVKIVAFEDWRCPFCDQFFKNTEPQIIKDYVDTGKAVIYYRQYQFLGPASVVAGNASECANEQGKFWDFHDYMYQNQPDESDTSMYTTDKLTQIAGTLGMDTNQFQSCLSANKYDKNVSQDLADGQKAGVSGTPTLFINGQPIVGAQPYSAFKTIIDQALSQ